MATVSSDDTAPYVLAGRYIWGEALPGVDGAAVHRAFDPVLERGVVVYLFGPQALALMGGREQFMRQFARVELLEHRSIRELLDFGTHEGAPFFVFADTGGETLAARLARSSLTEAEAERIVTRVRKALRRGNRRGLAHRRIDREHIYLDPRDGPQLFGFGWPAADGAATPDAALEALVGRLSAAAKERAIAPPTPAERPPAAAPTPAPVAKSIPVAESATGRQTSPSAPEPATRVDARPDAEPVAASTEPSAAARPSTLQRIRPIAAVAGVIAVLGLVVALAAAWFGSSSGTPGDDRNVALPPTSPTPPLTQAVAGAREDSLATIACTDGGWHTITFGEGSSPLFPDEQACRFFFARETCPAPAVLLDPPPGADLPAHGTTFRWSPGCDIESVELLVDGESIAGPLPSDAASAVAPHLPAGEVEVTLVSRAADRIFQQEATYHAAAP